MRLRRRDCREPARLIASIIPPVVASPWRGPPMICISIANESRRFALADMLTAAHHGDLLEVRLDRFEKAPDLGELLAARRKPVILSCRRPCDGGDWQGSE